LSVDTVRCPVCRKLVESGAASFPFCSERCRLVDLSGWLDGKYVISRPLAPSSPRPDAEDDEEASSSPEEEESP
jgi:endogenous inhibitor of DNA gyrase (YacG/DUF329 family)